MTGIKDYLKDSEDTVGGDFTNRPVRKDIIDLVKQNNTESPSPSGYPHFDEDKVSKYMNKE